MTRRELRHDGEHVCCACHAFKSGCCNAGHAAWLIAQPATDCLWPTQEGSDG